MDGSAGHTAKGSDATQDRRILVAVGEPTPLRVAQGQRSVYSRCLLGERQQCACNENPAGTRYREDAMNIHRRQLALRALAAGLLGLFPAVATEADEETAVAKNVEAFRAAQIAADAKAFDVLCAPELSYSHSDGRVEDKATFIANATSGKSKFLSLVYENVKVRVVGAAAVVRFHWLGESESVADGKKNATTLHILMNWQKQGTDWKLLSRASTKL